MRWARLQRAGAAAWLIPALAVLLGASQVVYFSVWRGLLVGDGAAGDTGPASSSIALTEPLAEGVLGLVGKEGSLDEETARQAPGLNDSARSEFLAKSLNPPHHAQPGSKPFSPPLESPSTPLPQLKSPPQKIYGANDQADDFPDDPSDCTPVPQRELDKLLHLRLFRDADSVHGKCLRGGEIRGKYDRSSDYFPARTSRYPMITGDTFREIADCVVDETRCPRNHSLCDFDGAIVFIYPEKEKLWFEEFHPKRKHTYVLISANADLATPVTSLGEKALQEQDSLLIGWFAVNPKSSKYPRLHALPIGIKNFAKNGALFYNRIASPVVWSLHERDIQRAWQRKLQMRHNEFDEWSRIAIFYTLRAGNSRERLAITQCLERRNRTAQIPVVPKSKLKLMDFEHLIEDVVKKSQYTISPPGTGMDCYRTWEALLSTSTPIIQRGLALNSALQCLPVIEVDDYCTLDENVYREQWERIRKGKYAWQRMLAPYWIWRIFKLAGRLPKSAPAKLAPVSTENNSHFLSNTALRCPANGIISLSYMTFLTRSTEKALRSSRRVEMCQSLESAARMGHDVVLMGYLASTFTGFGQRMKTILRAAVEIAREDPWCVVLFSDVTDVLFQATPQRLRHDYLRLVGDPHGVVAARSAKVVFGAECGCSPHVLRRTRPDDPTVCTNAADLAPQPYRYLNGGQFIGFAHNVEVMFETIFATRNISLQNCFDQGEFFLAHVRGQPSRITLDYQASLFLNLHYTRDPPCAPFEHLKFVNSSAHPFRRIAALIDAPEILTRYVEPGILHFNGKAKSEKINMGQILGAQQGFRRKEFNSQEEIARLKATKIIVTDDDLTRFETWTLERICPGYLDRVAVEG